MSRIIVAVNWFAAAGIVGFTGVAMGAFGAHALRPHLSPHALDIFQTAVLYHLVHAPVVLGLALYDRAVGRPGLVTLPAASFCVGLLLFSGSLYALALTGFKKLGVVTPVGGACLLLGWASIAWRLGRVP